MTDVTAHGHEAHYSFSASIATAGEERCKMAIEQIITKFPGPITVPASRCKCWNMIIQGGLMVLLFGLAAITIFRASAPVRPGFYVVLGIPVLYAVFGGFSAAVGVIALRKGSLRLDKDGFEVIGLVRRQNRWTHVRDFVATEHVRGQNNVWFKTQEPVRNLHEFIMSHVGDGSEFLPNIYPSTVRDLAQLMKGWQRVRPADCVGWE